MADQTITTRSPITGTATRSSARSGVVSRSTPRSCSVNRASARVGAAVRSSSVSGVWPVKITDVIPKIRRDFSPDILLALDDKAGGLIADSSGNGVEFTAIGSPSFEQPGIFANDGKSVHFRTGAHARSSAAFSVPNRRGTGVVVMRRQDKNAYAFAMGGRGMFVNNGAHLSWFTGALYSTGLRVGAGEPIVWGVNAETGEQLHYINGLPLSRTGGNAGWDNGAIAALGAGGSGNYTLDMDGSLAMFRRNYLTHAEHGALWREISGHDAHYYQTEIVEKLGLAELGVAGDIVCHLPLWEQSSVEAADVSMHGKHGAFINGPVLGKPPVGPGSIGSVETGLGSIDAPVNASLANDFTLWFRAREIVASRYANLCGIGNGTSWWSLRANAGRMGRQINDGTTGLGGYWGTYGGGLMHWSSVWNADKEATIVIRNDSATSSLDLWINGIRFETVDHSSLDASAFPTDHFRIGAPAGASNGTYRVDASLLSVSSALLSNDECLARSEELL